MEFVLCPEIRSMVSGPVEECPWRVPVSSATVDVTKAGRPTAADHASSSIFTTAAGIVVDNSRCASTGDIS
jgi:hypothetical protein